MIKQRDHYFKLDPQSGSVSMSMLQAMHPAIVYIISFTNLWCYQHSIEPMWTSWVRTEKQDQLLNAKSDTHRYRAADLSMAAKHGWTEEMAYEYKRAVEENFLGLGALVKIGDDLISKPIVLHDNGNGFHAHLQVRR